MKISRDRSQVDDRHTIRDPLNMDPVTQAIDLTSAAGWANTLAKTRIPQLFLTQNGLAGHVNQLQNELNRFKVSKLEGYCADGIDEVLLQIKFVRDSIKKSKEAARQNGFPLPNNLTLEFPFISDRLII